MSKNYLPISVVYIIALTSTAIADCFPLDPELNRYLIERGYDLPPYDGQIGWGEFFDVRGVDIDSSYLITNIDALFACGNVESVSLTGCTTLQSLSIESNGWLEQFRAEDMQLNEISFDGVHSGTAITLINSITPYTVNIISGTPSLYLDDPQLQSVNFSAAAGCHPNIYIEDVSFTSLSLPSGTCIENFELNHSPIEYVDFGIGSRVANVSINSNLIGVSGQVSVDHVTVSNLNLSDFDVLAPFLLSSPWACQSLTVRNCPNLISLSYQSNYNVEVLTIENCGLQYANLTSVENLCDRSMDFYFEDCPLASVCLPDTSSCTRAHVHSDSPAYIDRCQSYLSLSSIDPWIAELGCSYSQTLRIEAPETAIHIDSLISPTFPFVLLSQVPDSVYPGSPFDIEIDFQPTANGIYTSSIELYAQTEYSNTANPQHHSFALTGTVAPRYPTIQNLHIDVDEAGSVHLDWDPVDVTLCGLHVDPDFYLVYFNGSNPYSAGDYYFLGASATNSFTHPLAARFSEHTSYRVTAYLNSASRDLDDFKGLPMLEVESILKTSPRSGQW
jgi:hypothetical protein